MLRPYGMAPPAYHAYLAACQKAGVNPDRISQTIGTADASAKTHLKDGQWKDPATGIEYDYCAATDISVHHPTVLDHDVIGKLLTCLWQQGFVPFYRWPGHDGWPADDVEHMHMVYAGLHMKESLRQQVHDGLADLNGLVSHTRYTFFKPTPAECEIVRNLFLAHNPTNG